MPVTRRSVLKAGAGGLAAGMLPPFAFAQGAVDWDKIAAEAKREGELVFSTSLQSRVVTDVLKSFDTKYGVHVATITGRPAEVRERARIGHVSGKQAIDIIYGSEALTTIRYNEDKSVLDIPPQMKEALDRTRFKTQAPIIPVMTITYGMLINTRMVKPEDEPKSWFDLLDPKWKGKILLDDPRTNGAGHIYFTGTENHLGLDFHRKMAAQNPTLTRETQESSRRIARGEYPVFVGFALPDVTRLGGLPVKAIVPKEGVPYVLYGTTFVPNAPHPNAAMLFAHYCSSDEALIQWGMSGFGVGVDAVVKRIPEDVRYLADAKLLGTTDPRGQDDAFNKAKEIYKIAGG